MSPGSKNSTFHEDRQRIMSSGRDVLYVLLNSSCSDHLIADAQAGLSLPTFARLSWLTFPHEKAHTYTMLNARELSSPQKGMKNGKSLLDLYATWKRLMYLRQTLQDTFKMYSSPQKGTQLRPYGKRSIYLRQTVQNIFKIRGKIEMWNVCLTFTVRLAQMSVLRRSQLLILP